MPKKAFKLEASGKKRLLQIIVGSLVTGVILFLGAGRLDWWPAWAYMGSIILLLIGELAWIKFVDPGFTEVVNYRGRTPDKIKDWDKTWYRLGLPLPFLMLIVGAVDAGRFGWSSMPFTVQVIGFFMVLVSYIVPVWALAQKVPSLTMRIGIIKGQKICSTGPYKYIRHPMYAGIIVGCIGTPLLLGSWFAFIPAMLYSGLMIVRTILEDRDLQKELSDYRKYVKKVRFKLVPGVW
jgi:protein-S-isoprenylcysteine O-methyltransferase Ste14